MTWTNKDGLVQRFGVERSAQIQEGVSTRGVKNYLVVKLEDATALVDTLSTSTPPAEDAPFVPAGSIVTNAWFVATTDFTSGGAATLDIGFTTSTGALIDADGIDADIALAKLVDGAGTGVVNCDGAYVANGAGDGQQVLTNNAYVGFSYETAVYTAGAGTLILEYIKVE